MALGCQGVTVRSQRSARKCQPDETLHHLWKNRERAIAEAERPAARAAFDRALAAYRRIAEESQE